MRQFDDSLQICPHCGKSKSYTVPEYHLRPGTVLGGKFVVGAALGEGGFGITYVGKDRNLDLKVAIKEYFPSGFVNRNATLSATVSCGNTVERQDFFEKGRVRFLQEARTLARFSDEPGIVGIRDFFEENNTVYIVMEFLSGQTLKEYLNAVGTVPAEKLYDMLVPVMEALKVVHKEGVIHRDISPDNIMVTKKGLKLLDFGAARSTEGNKSLSVVLKHGYAPEEQYRSRGNQGPWTDVYSLCATMYKCITGNRPDDSNQRLIEDEVKPPSALGIEISPAFECALMKGLEVRQKDRWQDVDGLMAGLRGPTEGEEAPAEEKKAEKPPYIPPAPKPPVVTGPSGFAGGASKADNTVNTGPSAPAFTVQGEREYVFPAVCCGFGNGADAVPSWKYYRGEATTGMLKFPHVNGVIAASGRFTLALRRDGAVATAGQVTPPFNSVFGWRGIGAVSADDTYIAGLKTDGTVLAVSIATGGTVDIKGWRDMVSVSVGNGMIYGLRSDGAVFGSFFGNQGQRGVMLWQNAVAISAGINHVLALTKDGKVVADGSNNHGQCAVSGWSGVSAVSAGGHHSVALKNDGTVLASGNNAAGQCGVDAWRNIIAVSAGGFHTVALRSDGTVRAVGNNAAGQCEVRGWRDIVAIYAGAFHTVGLKSDGTLVACGNNNLNQTMVQHIRNVGLSYLKSPIRLPGAVGGR